MNIAICDDIEEIRSTMECCINEYFVEKSLDYSLEQFEKGTDLLNSNQQFDLVFLDIEFDNSTENGISIAKKFSRSSSIMKIANDVGIARGTAYKYL